MFRSLGGRRAGHDDDINSETQQIRDQLWQAFKVCLCPPVFDDQVLTLDPPEATHSVQEGGDETHPRGRRCGADPANSTWRRSRLPYREQWRGEDTACHNADEGPPVHHLLTSSTNRSQTILRLQQCLPPRSARSGRSAVRSFTGRTLALPLKNVGANNLLAG